MSEFLQKEVSIPLSSNHFLQEKIDINSDLSCFVLIDSKNEKILKPLLNKIVDYLLDNLHSKDIYNSFLVSLESINIFLKNLEKKENSLIDLNIFIGVNNKKDFYFSKIGSVSCYMVNSKNEFIELTEKAKKDIVFDYISSGTLNTNEKIIISNIPLNNYFTSEDVQDISVAGSMENTLEVIEKIVKEEEKESSIFLGVFSIGFVENNEVELLTNISFDVKNIFYKILDYSFSKRIYAYLLLLIDKFHTKSKNIKIIISVFGIIVSTFLLYNIISGIVGITIESNTQETSKNQLIEAREYLRLANQNISNPDLFNINVLKVEEILSQIREKNIFLTDVDSISDDLSIIKKQFNGVEVFSMDTMKLLFPGNFSDAIKFLDINKKGYLVGKSSIFGPIISGQEIKHHIFADLDIDDEFLDATVVGENIVLISKKNRVILFEKDNTFKYINVIGQQTWQGSKIVESYNSSLYMSDSKENQIYKYTPTSGSYTAGVPYLNESDSQNIGKIISIGIDGGIYFLKDDLTIVKFFSSPYRLENIVLNKLPKNYTKENSKTPYLYVRPNLNLVYMLLNDKIFIFKPNTKSFRDTKSLTYLGQIEGKEQSILTFNVPRDGEIQVVSSKGIYKLNFEEKEDKIILR